MRGVFVYITKDGIEWEFITIRAKINYPCGTQCVTGPTEQLYRATFAATSNPGGDWEVVKSRSTVKKTVTLSELRRLAARTYVAYIKDVSV